MVHDELLSWYVQVPRCRLHREFRLRIGFTLSRRAFHPSQSIRQAISKRITAFTPIAIRPRTYSSSFPWQNQVTVQSLLDRRCRRPVGLENAPHTHTRMKAIPGPTSTACEYAAQLNRPTRYPGSCAAPGVLHCLNRRLHSGLFRGCEIGLPQHVDHLVPHTGIFLPPSLPRKDTSRRHKSDTRGVRGAAFLRLDNPEVQELLLSRRICTGPYTCSRAS